MTKWSTNQISTVFAAVSSWGLDAFDFFLLVFVIDNIAQTYGVENEHVSIAVFLTLALRPIGAIIFGKAAEKYGRKPTLMANVALFSILAPLSAFAPTLTIFIGIRCVYGIAMGGIWGVASTLAFETAPQEAKGFISGLFQAGYPLGYLTASVLYGLLFNSIGWQNLFIIGVFPIFLVAFIYFKVEESAIWLKNKVEQKDNIPIIPITLKYWPLCIYAILLMTCFNFLSHGTQDAYPSFLKKQHHLDAHIVGTIAVFYNIAAILGGISFGTLSQKIGRAKAIILAAFLTLLVIPLWAFSHTIVLLGVGAFLIQFAVQGAWGVVPALLNELVPASTRTVLPGLFYQLGNLLASVNLPLQMIIAKHFNGQYSISLAIITACASSGIIILILANWTKKYKMVT